MNPATGPKSVSFKAAAVGVLAGLGQVVTAYVQSPSLHASANAVPGMAMATLAILGKLVHDGIFNKANLASAAASFNQQLPALKSDIAQVIDVATNDIPAVHNLASQLSSRVSSVESTVSALAAKIPDEAAITAAAKKGLSDFLSSSGVPATTTTTPAAPVPAPAVAPPA